MCVYIVKTVILSLILSRAWLTNPLICWYSDNDHTMMSHYDVTAEQTLIILSIEHVYV